MDRLERELDRGFTLVSAPAGFGKTTLVAQWASLSRESILRAIRSGQPTPLDQAMTTLVDKLASIAPRVVLVLDDHHEIDSDEVEAALALLVEHRPSTVSIVVTSRKDPPLPLARMRARRRLSEFRVTDLHFSTEETRAFLHETMGLSISSADVQELAA